MKIRLNPNRHRAGIFGLPFLNGGGKRVSTTTTTTAPTNVGAEGGSIAIGPDGKFIAGGSDYSGANLTDATITEIDLGAVEKSLALAQGVTTDLTKFVSAQNDAATIRQKSLDETLRGIFDKLAEKDTEEKTGFASLLISPLFWIILSGLAVVSLFVWRKPQ